MMAKRICVSVDPGVVTLGFAIWDARTWGGAVVPQPLQTGAFNLKWGRQSIGSDRSPREGAEQAALKVVEYLERQITKSKWGHVDQVWCERMEFRSNHVGIAAIDDVLNVAFACGAVGHMAGKLGAAFHPAPVSIWKGNMTKLQVATRILKRWGLQDHDEEMQTLGGMLSDPQAPSHDWDAVGIGLFGQGFFE